jgi:hypothetical protein
MKRPLLIGTVLVIAGLITWLSWDGWLYLQRGYSFRIGLAGEAGSVFHVDFPTWRTAVHAMLWAAAMAAVFLYVTGHRRASTVAWATFAAVVITGFDDVVQYGTMGSPTSMWTVELLLLLAVLIRFGRLAPVADT